MVELTEATMRGGVSDCLKATLHKDNLPTYVGIGGGLVVGNAVGKKLQSYYDNTFYVDGDPTKGLIDEAKVPGKWVQLAARTAGRLAASGLLCALGGSLEGDAKETMQMAAVGSAGFVVIDAARTLGKGESWVDDYLTLEVPVRRAVRRAPQRTPQRAAPIRPVALQGRPAMEAAALAPRLPGTGRPMMETAALTSTSGASF